MKKKHTDITPYEEHDETKKSQVARMFDNIAPYYDFLNRFLSAGIDGSWRRKTISVLEKERPKTLLDIATGTADMAIEAAKRLNLEKIIGVDISSEMLRIGRDKVKKKGLDGTITLEKGDSENLTFKDNEFDAISAAFGVRNFENLEAGLTEMYRVLHPGGTMVILEFSRPRVFPLKQLFNVYFKNILPVIGRIKSKDPKAYKYLYESVQAFPDYNDFTNILQQIGFKDTSWRPLTFGICTIYTAKK